MREATREEIDLVVKWFNGFELAKWLSQVSGIVHIDSFVLNGTMEYNDEGYDFRTGGNTLVINGEEILPELDWDAEYDAEFKKLEALHYRYSVNGPEDYCDGPTNLIYNILEQYDGSMVWDRYTCPVKLMVEN